MMDTLPNPLGGERRTFMWRGHRIAYVVRGTGVPFVFVHSVHASAWSMEWRHNVPALAAHGRCFALDLLGFGASDRPPVHYTAAMYLDLLADFLRDVVGEPAVLVGSSLGGTYAIATAAAHPALVRAVCAIGPAGVSRLTTTGGTAGRLAESLLRRPVVGAGLFGALVSRASIRFFLRDIYANRAALTPDTIELFWQSAQHPAARFAPAAFVGMQLNCDIREALPALTMPVLLAWGEAAVQTPLREAAVVRQFTPTAEFAVLPGGDLPHDEHPEAFNRALVRFLTASGVTPRH